MIYPRTTGSTASWQIRDDYRNLTPSLQKLFDFTTDRCGRADVLTDMLLQDFISETRYANENLRNELLKLYRQVISCAAGNSK